MKLEFYVLNYDFNRQKVINFNIFENYLVYDRSIEEAKKYLAEKEKYNYIWNDSPFESKKYYGWEGFVKSIEKIIMSEEWARREYEISVGDAFENDLDKFEKWDCYQQILPNIEIIAREVIYQVGKNKKRSHKLEYSDSGSADISFCNAADCTTQCKRNQNLKFFKTFKEQIKEYNGTYSVSSFDSDCSDYEK